MYGSAWAVPARADRDAVNTALPAITATHDLVCTHAAFIRALAFLSLISPAVSPPAVSPPALPQQEERPTPMEMRRP